MPQYHFVQQVAPKLPGWFRMPLGGDGCPVESQKVAVARDGDTTVEGLDFAGQGKCGWCTLGQPHSSALHLQCMHAAEGKKRRTRG